MKNLVNKSRIPLSASYTVFSLVESVFLKFERVLFKMSQGKGVNVIFLRRLELHAVSCMTEKADFRVICLSNN